MSGRGFQGRGDGPSGVAGPPAVLQTPVSGKARGLLGFDVLGCDAGVRPAPAERGRCEGEEEGGRGLGVLSRVSSRCPGHDLALRLSRQAALTPASPRRRPVLALPVGPGGPLALQIMLGHLCPYKGQLAPLTETSDQRRLFGFLSFGRRARSSSGPGRKPSGWTRPAFQSSLHGRVWTRGPSEGELTPSCVFSPSACTAGHRDSSRGHVLSA